MPQQSVLRGALLLVSAEFLLAVMAALIKHLSAELPNEMVVFFRNLFGWLILLPFLLQGGMANLKTQRLGIHLLRAGTGLAAMYGFFFVISTLPLAEAALVKLTAPFFLPLIAFWWLGERISTYTKLAILVGFVGVVFILKPGGNFQPEVLVGLAAACLASFAKVCIRKMADTEPATRVVFYFATFATLVSAVPLTWSWQMPGPETWLWLLAMGVVGTFGQLLMTQAYQVAQPGKIGPYIYTSVVFASLFGWWFWDEWLTWTTTVGSALIIGAGILNLKKDKIARTK